MKGYYPFRIPYFNANDCPRLDRLGLSLALKTTPTAQEKERAKTMAKLTKKMKADILYRHAVALGNGNITLDDVYGRYSEEKYSAYLYCRVTQCKFEGRNGAIIAHNTFMFTYGFYFDTIDEETAEVTATYFYYITPTYDYTFEVERYV